VGERAVTGVMAVAVIEVLEAVKVEQEQAV
jgi:hypothetical protein